MLCLPVLKTAPVSSTERHVEWLRLHLGGYSSEAIDHAIEVAEASSSHNLSMFLDAFVSAYLSFEDVDAGDSEADAELLSLLRRHWTDLIGGAVAVNVYVKSLLVRTSTAKDRSTVAQLAFVRNRVVGPAGYALGILLFEGLAAHDGAFVSSSILPRGP